MEISQLKSLEDIDSNGGITSRFVVPCPSGECVLLRKSGRWRKEPFSSNQELTTYLSSNMFTQPGIIVEKDLDPWTSTPLHQFNCHTLSVGSLVGIAPEFWIEGVANEVTLNQNPLQILLRDFFVEVGKFRKEQWDVISSNSDITLSENDVVVLSHQLDTGIEYFHSATIKIIENQIYLLGKYGEGQIVLTPPEHIYFEYHTLFSQFHIYRWNGESL